MKFFAEIGSLSYRLQMGEPLASINQLRGVQIKNFRLNLSSPLIPA